MLLEAILIFIGQWVGVVLIFLPWGSFGVAYVEGTVKQYGRKEERDTQRGHAREESPSRTPVTFATHQDSI